MAQVILAGLAFLTYSGNSDIQYVLIVDSGSTGTRMYVSPHSENHKTAFALQIVGQTHVSLAARRVAYKWKEEPGQPPALTAVAPKTAQQKGVYLHQQVLSCFRPLRYVAQQRCQL